MNELGQSGNCKAWFTSLAYHENVAQTGMSDVMSHSRKHDGKYVLGT